MKPNTAQFATKVVDGEAILINLSDGMYYSMDLVGGFIWSLIELRHDLDAISTAVARRYGVAEETAKHDVETLVQQLLDEKIVLAAQDDAPPDPGGIEAAPASEDYTAPQLNKFDDMVDLFAIDPPLPELSRVKNGN